MDYLIQLFTAITGVVVILIYRSYRKFYQTYENLKFIPGPKVIYPFGNMLKFRERDKHLQQFEKFFDEYGDTYKVFLGPFRISLFTANYKLVENVLGSTKHLWKSEGYDFLRNWLGEGLLTSKPTKWKKHRKVITPAFHFQVLEKFSLMLETPTRTLIKILKTKVHSKNFDIFHNTNLCSLDIMCETSMGTKLNVQENENCEYLNAVKEISNVLVDRPVSLRKYSDYTYRFTWDCYREKRALRVLHGMTNSMIEKKREEIKEIQKRQTEKIEDEYFLRKKKLTFLEILLLSKIDGKPLDDISIREEVDTFLFEGHDTITSGLAFTLYCLANHPDVQMKAYEEQIGIFGNEKNPRPQLGDLHEMKYLEMVIKESLRLFPSVPLIGRTLVEDLVTDDCVYPKGMDFTISIFRLHRNPELFPNPNDFIPTRFLKIDSKYPFAYIPFSAGSRNCIGQKFAMLEMKYVISSILRNFELLPADPPQDLKLAFLLILRSLNGVNIRIKERS